MSEAMRQSVIDYIRGKYGSEPEYLWQKDQDTAAFRHEGSLKWFALLMRVAPRQLGLPGGEPLDILNLKQDDFFLRDQIMQEDGILPAFHMNKMHWISVVLDGRVSEDRIVQLIDWSFMATASAREKRALRGPKAWIIPSNPKYYDIVHAFDGRDEIDWKQGAGIRRGDTVYLYVGAPVSAVLYQCLVTETDIPYEYQSDDLTIKALMKIRLQRRYPPDRYTFEVLKKEYRIFAVRGPRGIPPALSEELNRR